VRRAEQTKQKTDGPADHRSIMSMYTSKFTKKLLAQTKSQQHQPASATSMANPAGEGYRAAAIPVGTAFPDRRLPVRHHASPVPGADPSALPGIDDVDDDMPPPQSDAPRSQVKPPADDHVVRTAGSPLLYGPAAPKHAVAAQRVAVAGRRAQQASPAPLPLPSDDRNNMPSSSSIPARARLMQQQPGRPGSQQGGRPPSASSSRRAEPAESSAPVDFASELEAIGRANKALPPRRATSSMQLQQPGSPALEATARSDTGLDNYETASHASASALANTMAGGEREDDDDLDAGRTATGKPLHVPYTPEIRAKVAPGTNVQSHVAPKPMVLKDFQLLAEACQRAGRARMEAHAYFKIAEILCGEKETVPQGVSYFKRFLNLSRRLNDLQGEAKALNCLGIVHHQLGDQRSLQLAREYHEQHAQIADAAGIFIANTNLGLLAAKMGDVAGSMECHKQALQYAVRAGDRGAESLALANLGKAGSQQGDFATARVCVERHLELSTTLNDVVSSCQAYEQLGVLAMQRGDYPTASDNFLLALDVALREGDQETGRKLRCQVGVVQGLLRMEGHVSDATRSMSRAQ
jgi:tetratricopeptide (TPR) repeat protein